jgi:hypothetical protein
MTQTTFDYEAGQAAKEQGLDRACNPFYRRQLIACAKSVAHLLADQTGPTTFDDVYKFMEDAGWHPEVIGNAAGSIFRDPWFECIGWKPSERVTNHKRPIRVWRLK